MMEQIRVLQTGGRKPDPTSRKNFFYKKRGEVLFGGAILNDYGEMIGSVIIYDVPDRATLDALLKNEPYIYNHVWEKIEIRPFRPAKIE